MSQGSITPSTSKGKGLQSSKLSSSLKERLKRCGRYHPGTPVSHLPKSESVSGLISVSHAGSSDAVSPNNFHKASTSSSPDTPLSRRILSRKTFSLTPTHSKKTLLNHSTPLSERIQQNSCNTIKIKTNSKEFHCPLKSPSSFNHHVRSLSSKNAPESDVCDSADFLEKETIEDSPDCVCDKTSNGDNVITHPAKELDAKSSTACNLASSGNDLAPLSKAKSSSNLEDSQTDKDTLNKLVALRKEMQDQVKDKEEKLRKLKMVKMYREKNDLTELQRLIDLWRSVTQTALTDLLDLHPHPRPSMSQLIAQLGVEPSFVGYDEDEDSFV